MDNLKTKVWIIVTIVFLISIATGGFYYQNWIKAYYYDYTGNHFKPGDKVYRRGKLTPYIYRMIRPITADDVDKLNISDNEKSISKQNLKSGELKMLQTDKNVNQDSLHTGEDIGTFMSRQFIVKHFDGKSGVIRYYAIKPNWKVIKTVPSLADHMPEGYIYADDKLYVPFYMVSDQ